MGQGRGRRAGRAVESKEEMSSSGTGTDRGGLRGREQKRSSALGTRGGQRGDGYR